LYCSVFKNVLCSKNINVCFLDPSLFDKKWCSSLAVLSAIGGTFLVLIKAVVLFEWIIYLSLKKCFPFLALLKNLSLQIPYIFDSLADT